MTVLIFATLITQLPIVDEEGKPKTYRLSLHKIQAVKRENAEGLYKLLLIESNDQDIL